MIRVATPLPPPYDYGRDETDNEFRTLEEEIEHLRAENRRLAVSLGGFSAFMASRGLLEEAWNYVNNIHSIDDDHG